MNLVGVLVSLFGSLIDLWAWLRDRKKERKEHEIKFDKAFQAAKDSQNTRDLEHAFMDLGLRDGWGSADKSGDIRRGSGDRGPGTKQRTTPGKDPDA